jgi:valyl-tRNA synthetase
MVSSNISSHIVRFVKCGDLAKKSIELVKTGEIKIIPKHFENTWYRWLENIHDWCISRQLWWGHRIPAYRVITKENNKEQWVVARSEKEAHEQVKLPPGTYTLEQVRKLVFFVTF